MTCDPGDPLTQCAVSLGSFAVGWLFHELWDLFRNVSRR